MEYKFNVDVGIKEEERERRRERGNGEVRSGRTTSSRECAKNSSPTWKRSGPK